jgi:NADPH:quinone reductase-like Zn-dependent oxidoreductase
MKAMVVRAYGAPDALKLEDLPRPEPGPGEILVEVHAVTVNRARDTMIINGIPDKPETLPLVPGMDPAGRVAALGPGVGGLKVDDRVVITSRICCGDCPDCDDGYDGDCRNTVQVGIERWGGYAEFVAVPVANADPIPENLSYAEAAVVLRHFPTAFQLLDQKAGLKAGEWVLVMGSGGGLGSTGVQAAKLMGATVIAGAGAADRLAVGMDMGADYGVNYREDDLTEAVMKITGGRGVNVVFENISDPTTWPKALNCLGHRGRMVTAGAHGGGTVPLKVHSLYINRWRIIGGAGAGTGDVKRTLDYAGQGKLRTVIDEVMPLHRLHDAFDLIGTGTVKGKIVVDPSMA